MEILQEFAIRNIHCSPYEDRQYRFELVRLTIPTEPIYRRFRIYGRESIMMPDQEHRYHVYSIGDIPTTLLNLKGRCCCACPSTGWINVEDDMNDRSFIFQMYNDEGINLPRSYIYYQITRENSLIIAVKVDDVIRKLFDIDSFRYIRTYSNPYYRSEATNDSISIKSFHGGYRASVSGVLRYVESLPKKGTTLYYYNGYFSDTFHNDYPDDTLIEVFHDTGIRSVEKYKVKDLRTFESRLDKKMKFLIFRRTLLDHIQYEDDLEIYVVGGVGNESKKRSRGLYYYQNREDAVRNVTDKDYSLMTDYVNYHASLLMEKFQFNANQHYVYIITRDPMHRIPLVYSNAKFHELYKLPFNIQENVMLNTGHSIEDFRVETLEDSWYWKVAQMLDLSKLTKEVAFDTVGYSSAAFYYANTPNRIDSANIDVPYIYAHGSYAYEYDKDGVLTTPIRHVEGLLYKPHKPDSKFVEFLVQHRYEEFNIPFHDVGTTVPIDTGRDYVIISGILDDRLELQDEWEDVTSTAIIKNGKVTVPGDKFIDGVFCIYYLDEVFQVSYETGFESFLNEFTIVTNLTYNGKKVVDEVPFFFENVEIFLNGHRLIEGLDFNVDYTRYVICNKSYLDYTKEKQTYLVRASGIVLEEHHINQREVRGFVNSGVILRNKRYDVKDDRVFSVWIGGRLQDPDTLKFAEDDSKIRVDDKLNGKPYVLSDRLIPIIKTSGMQTYPYYQESTEKDKRISNLFDLVYPEKKVNTFNTIENRHLIYSPTVSRITHDVLNGVIPPETIKKEYQLNYIRQLLERDYDHLVKIDPLLKDLPYKFVEIQPDFGNKTIEVNVFQYRFIYNVIKVLTNGRNELCDMSVYFSVNNETLDGDNADIYKVESNSGLTPFDNKR